jgi:hypothetical protein
LRNVHQQVAILAHDIDEQVKHGRGAAVKGEEFIGGSRFVHVKPTRLGGVALPYLGGQLLHFASFQILDAALIAFDRKQPFVLATVPRDIAVNLNP